MYLEIKGHDNDFGWPLVEALEELWKFIRENNSECFFDTEINNIEEKFISPNDLFQCLNNKGHLVPLIHRTWVLRTYLRDVETMTRNLDKEGVSKYMRKDWLTKMKPIEDEYTKYLNDFSIEFHQTNNFTSKDENGEHAWLNLTNGEAGCF